MASILKNSAGYTSNYVEYLVPKKNTRGMVFAKIGIVLALVIIFAVSAAFIAKKVPAVIAVYLTCFVILGWYLWRFVTIEYEYVIASGEMEMEVIYGRRQRKSLAAFKLRDIEFCAPLTAEYKGRLENPEIKKIIKSCSSEKANEAYFMIFKNQNGEKQAMYFDATKKTVDILKFYTGSATVVSDKLTF